MVQCTAYWQCSYQPNTAQMEGNTYQSENSTCMRAVVMEHDAVWLRARGCLVTKPVKHMATARSLDQKLLEGQDTVPYIGPLFHALPLTADT